MINKSKRKTNIKDGSAPVPAPDILVGSGPPENTNNHIIIQIQNDIKEIKNNHLKHIETDISNIKTKIVSVTDNIGEIKNILHVIKNSINH